MFDKDFNYIFMPDEKMLSAIEIDYQNNKINVNLNKIYENKTIDISETLSNTLGKFIKKITKNYIEFENNLKINPNDLDYKLLKPLIWW